MPYSLRQVAHTVLGAGNQAVGVQRLRIHFTSITAARKLGGGVGLAKHVPSSFQDLKSQVKQRLQHGSGDIHSDIIEMGDAMLQSGVEPKSAQDRMAKHVWQAAGPHQKQQLAHMVTEMAKEDDSLQ